MSARTAGAGAGPGRRAAGAVLAVLVLAAVALARPAAAAAQDPAASEVRLTGIEASSWVPRTGTWTLDLRVQGAPADGQVRAVIRDGLADREALDRALFGVVEGDRKATIPPVDLATQPTAEGGGRRVSLAVTLESEAADIPGWKFLPDGLRPGVYPVEVEVRDGDGGRVGGTVAFLTRVPSGREQGADRSPLLVAPVLSFGAEPTVGADGTARLPPEVVDEGEVIVDGLSFSADLPATLAPRPETIEALARDGAGTELLADLRRASRDRQVLDAPYVDVPLSAWVEAGLGEELTRQRVRGNAVLTDRLGPVDSSTFLSRSGLTPPAVAELWNVGVRTVVFGPGALDTSVPEVPFTVSAGEGRSVVAVPADTHLTTLLTFRGDPVLDRSGLAAQLALLAAREERPAGVTLVAPPGWPGRGEELAGLADLLLDPAAPVQPTTITDLVARVAVGPERALPGVMLEDLGDQPEALRRARARLASYASMTGARNGTVLALDQRLLLSGAATSTAAERRRYVERVLATVDRGLTGIEAPPRQTITLTASDGTVPLHFRSGFDEPVQVLVEIDASSHIELPDGARQLVTLEPGTTRVPVAVHARAPGDAAFDITVRTPDGVEVLDEVRYTVRSTAISGIGLFLSVGAVVFLVLWWARHWRRSRRARREAAARAAADALVEGPRGASAGPGAEVPVTPGSGRR
ncbi:MAG TPA: DUF6049 family protein [Acidimicrobiales bacterium]|nr:DUF6049 family protein [Acidimicrobiales bacterium]